MNQTRIYQVSAAVAAVVLTATAGGCRADTPPPEGGMSQRSEVGTVSVWEWEGELVGGQDPLKIVLFCADGLRFAATVPPMGERQSPSLVRVPEQDRKCQK